MTNLETLKRFSEIIEACLKEKSVIDFTDLLYWADSYSRDMTGVPLLMKNNDNFIATLEEYLEYVK